MTHFTRAQWRARAPRARYDFGGSDVRGAALHWPAMSKPVRGFATVAAALRGWQDDHMDTQRWSDIGYQEAVDQDGHSYELRGLTHKSGANGNDTLNDQYGAILLILAPGEQPTEAMMRTARARIAEHRRLHPSSRSIVGHGEIRPGGSACPGPIAQGLIDRGAFEPTASTAPAPRPDPEDDMTPEQAKQLAEIHGRLFGVTEQRHIMTADGPRAAKLLDTRDGAHIMRQVVAGRVDVDALAEAIVAQIPAGEAIDRATVKAGVLDALRAGTEE